jgi:hypothetical protein
LKPWRVKQWCIPPAANAAFVWKMEDVLDVYTQSYDAERVLVCMDETTKQQIVELRPPMAPAPGREGRYDAEYKRNGVSNVFLFFAPLQGWRHVEITDQRTQLDWAEVVRQLVDDPFPEARKMVLVMDNLNIHSPALLYEAFQPEEAKRIADRLEIHYTPKHGSWLNMAEIEMSVLVRQCLSRRIPDQNTLRSEAIAWAQTRNASAATIDWRFTTDDARIKLKRLYPSFVE